MTETLASPVDPAVLSKLVVDAGFDITDEHVIPGRPAAYRPIPGVLDPRLRAYLSQAYGGSLYAHQSLAIERVLAGSDVCLATPTASGKSLPFMAAAVELCLRDPSAVVLAFYPMKALIRDQLDKWQEFLAPFGLRVGFIDGSVPMEDRRGIVQSCRIVAMTPDVAHAWVMTHLQDEEVNAFLKQLRLLVLDEAHVYDGVFGTNMAYFLRRLAVAAGEHRLLCSTATIGSPADYIRQLTGRDVVVLDGAADGSARHEKRVLLAEPVRAKSFDAAVKLLVALVEHRAARFLAFCDSRKAVERFVAATHRHGRSDADDTEEASDLPPSSPAMERILPYRAGYEEEDRQRIQAALANGGLGGVVSTSALELGLDIGDIDVVVLMNSPLTTKSFHQRIGRAGRRRPAVCVVIDDQGRVGDIAEYAARPPEPSWIYVENRYIQYAQALCAASEVQSRGQPFSPEDYAGLPATFSEFVRNELNPTHAVDDELFPLKQQGQANPQYEFPLRNGVEPSFTVNGAFGAKLGSLSYAQVLREAYPGAMYYYMAKPNRVVRVDYKNREIATSRGQFVTTQPNAQAMVFADLHGGLIQALRSDDGFLAESHLQVSERVLGFTELRGQNRLQHEYGPGSSYSQRPLQRLFKTTGVCWAFPARVPRSEALAKAVMAAFCEACGIQERDVGCGLFRANAGPFDASPVQGMAVYDATFGSLRLTQRLVDRLHEVLRSAVEDAQRDAPGILDLQRLRAAAARLVPSTPSAPGGGMADPVPAPSSEWATVIKPGESAVYVHAVEGPIEVKVLGYRYTPQGLMYDLEHPTSRWSVAAHTVRALDGTTKTLRVNLVTGEEMPS